MEAGCSKRGEPARSPVGRSVGRAALGDADLECPLMALLADTLIPETRAALWFSPEATVGLLARSDLVRWEAPGPQWGVGQ